MVLLAGAACLRAVPPPASYRLWLQAAGTTNLADFRPFGDGTVLAWPCGSVTGSYVVQRCLHLPGGSWFSLAFGAVTNTAMTCALPGDNGIQADAEISLAATWSGEDSALGEPANEVYVLRAGGNVTEFVRLTTTRWNRVHVAVSPDGRYLADARLHQDTDSSGDLNAADWKTLWVVDLVAVAETAFWRDNLDACIGGMDWSPDAEWIYFAGRATNDGAMNIYRQRVDGSGFSNITGQVDFGVPDAQKWISDVSVSSDGGRMAFAFKPIQVLATNINMKLGTLSTDGTNLQWVTEGGPGLTNGFGPYGPGDFDPEFSPDGTHLCFQRATDEYRNWGVYPSHDICKVRLSDGAVTRLTPASNRHMFGISDWASNDVICCTAWFDGDGVATQVFTGVVTLKADGSELRFFDRLPPGGTHARWIRSN